MSDLTRAICYVNDHRLNRSYSSKGLRDPYAFIAIGPDPIEASAARALAELRYATNFMVPGLSQSHHDEKRLDLFTYCQTQQHIVCTI